MTHSSLTFDISTRASLSEASVVSLLSLFSLFVGSLALVSTSNDDNHDVDCPASSLAIKPQEASTASIISLQHERERIKLLVLVMVMVPTFQAATNRKKKNLPQSLKFNGRRARPSGCCIATSWTERSHWKLWMRTGSRQ